MGFPEFAVYYPEAGGLLYCRHLGTGVDGSTDVVQQLTTGQLLVRKTIQNKKGRDVEPICYHPEVSHHYPHENIPALIEARNDYTLKQTSTIIISEFCNRGDVRSYADQAAWHRSRSRLPEMGIWCFLSDMLSAVGHIHSPENDSIIHRDIHPGNCFVDFEYPDSLPKFFLGDFGRSSRTDHLKGKALTHMMLADISRIACVGRSMMTDRPFRTADERWEAVCRIEHNKQYSSLLHSILRSFREAKHKLESLDDYERWYVSMKRTLDAMVKAQPKLETEPANWRRNPISARPLLFDSEIQLLEHFDGYDCPPATWSIATVVRDPFAGTKLIDIGQEVYTSYKGKPFLVSARPEHDFEAPPLPRIPEDKMIDFSFLGSVESLPTGPDWY